MDKSNNTKTVSLTIDGKNVTAREGQTILEVALTSDIYIPHLCHHPDLLAFNQSLPAEACFQGGEVLSQSSEQGAYQGCGLCLVGAEGQKEPALSCVTQVKAGMTISLSGPEINSLRQQNLATILARHPHACLTCAQREGCSLTLCSNNVPQDERCCPVFNFCELRKVAEYVGISPDTPRYKPQKLYVELDKPLFIRDYNLCIGCLRCVRVCDSTVGVKALSYILKNGEVVVGSSAPSLEESGCRFCGACVEVCPTGAFRDKELKPGDRRAALVPCETACPVGMDVPGYVDFVSRGKYQEAAGTIRESVPLSFCLGHICSHPCEAECRREKLDQAVAICDLKRFALEAAGPQEPAPKIEVAGKKVAIVGGGPAGLVAAYFLAQKGHSVAVFEGREEPGGMLRWALPEYRLPHLVVRQEIEGILASGVKIETSALIDSQALGGELRRKTWDAVFISTGAQESKRLDLDGVSLEGVHWGLEFLQAAKKGKAEDFRGRTVVIGGGNVAIDAAMTALRLGAARVDLVCLEEREKMPAYPWEIHEAEEESVAIHTGWGPARILGSKGKVRGLELERCTSVFDGRGNFSPRFDTSQRMTIEAESVIFALGQKSDLSFLPQDLGIKTDENQTLRVHPETLETNLPGLFAAGEVASGPGPAVEAMASGKRAASSIDKYLGGDGILADHLAPGEKRSLWLGKEQDFYPGQRVEMSSLPGFERRESFKLIRPGYTEEEARREAGRCLRCDLRFKLTPGTLPPSKWLEFTPEKIRIVPEAEGVFELLDAAEEIISISGTANLRQALQEQLSLSPEARYFHYELDPLYTKRESELIQHYLQKYGHLPPGSEGLDDLF